MNAILDFTTPHLLRSREELDAAVAEIDRLLDLDPAPGSDAFDRLEFLTVLVRAYEQEHHPDIWKPLPPRELVGYVLEQRGMRCRP